mmetsp:Transcript_28874/g.94382  ORF Transcript_28874/g.94382 Transcript_28874/m.94382 type:complete len:850 (+) Transcript_28874:44-2593(+)
MGAGRGSGKKDSRPASADLSLDFAGVAKKKSQVSPDGSAGKYVVAEDTEYDDDPPFEDEDEEAGETKHRRDSGDKGGDDGEEEDEDKPETLQEKFDWAMRRVNYILDSYLSSSSFQTFILAVMAVLLTVVGGIIYSEVEGIPYEDGVWNSWTWVSAGILGVKTPPMDFWPRVISSIITVLGILYFAVVLGLVVEAVQAKMDALRKGKSTVVEKEHTVMLGWTDKSLMYIREICNANESEGGGVIAVLCEHDKEKMDAELSHHLKKEDMMGTKVVFRSGSRVMSTDLMKVSVEEARSVVVLSNPELEANQADAEILQVVLNLSNLELQGHVVAEVRDIDSEPLVQLIGRGNVETVVSHDIIGRLMLMSVRQPGLAAVYSSVLGFEGDEFYMEQWDDLTGLPFSAIPTRMPDAVAIGVRQGGEQGTILLNPKPSYKITEDDELIVLAEDNDTYKPEVPVKVVAGSAPPPSKVKADREYILFCGWRRDLRDIIMLLDEIVAPGSELHIMAGVPLHKRRTLLLEGGLDVDALRHLKLVHHVGNTSMRRHIQELPMSLYTSAIIFADESQEGDIMESDSHCLATLLLIRDIQTKVRNGGSTNRSSNKSIFDEDDDEGAGSEVGGEDLMEGMSEVQKSMPIVCEILDPRTQRTIRENEAIAKVSDFLQSNDMVSKILAMVSEDRGVKHILDELLAPGGVSMACIPAAKYAQPGERVSFFQMQLRAQTYGEQIVGFVEPNEEGGGWQEPTMNPPEKKTKRTWDDCNLVTFTGGHGPPKAAAAGADSPSQKPRPSEQVPLTEEQEAESFSLRETMTKVEQIMAKLSSSKRRLALEVLTSLTAEGKGVSASAVLGILT